MKTAEIAEKMGLKLLTDGLSEDAEVTDGCRMRPSQLGHGARRGGNGMDNGADAS